MQSKSELLVFNKKEIFIILVLLVLVALFSFTLGLRLGRNLGVAQAPPADHAPLDHKDEHAEGGHAAPHDSHEQTANDHADEHGDARHEVAPAAQAKKTAQTATSAEDKADAELAQETVKENLSIGKPVPMALPKDKKGETRLDASYTLQVGSHRTVAEAAEQVTSLKRSEFEAFYIEAKVPGKGTWYRVGVGVFPTKEAAERAAAKWKASKVLPPYIIQKISE